PYFISISPFAINRSNLIKIDSKGKYLIPNNSNYGYIELDPLIINDNKGNPGIVLGENENEPYFKGISAEHISGNSEVVITYSVYDRSVITDDLYEIGFTRKETELYGLNYYVKNLTKNVYLIENIDFENYQSNIQNLKEGFLVNLNWQEPGINEVTFEGNSQWFNEFNNLETGVFYLGIDVLQREKITPVNPLKFSTAISVDKMADVELRFGETGKAYRYIREAVRYFWAGNENPELGFVDIPVTAHKLYSNGETEQLSIGFLENAFPFDSLAHPDLKWNPGSNIGQSKEYLVIFNSKYSENYEAHQAYYGTKENPALVSLGYNLESDKDSLNLIARSPWFDALYVVGFELPEYYDDFVPSGKLIIDAKQVLSENDKYVFKIKKEKTEVEEKEQFEKINVFPNPLFAYNSAGSYFGNNPDEPFVTFSHLPKTATLKIYTLSGNLIRELQKNNLSSAVQWDLQNEYGRRVGSGIYLAIIESPGIGQKVLKFSI
ncbi:MAG: hypothetical protein KDC88_17240, partial [Ignavibacteriae bacterium]|nr:hypothetical protein [Ignavibacteriota bacterium]